MSADNLDQLTYAQLNEAFAVEVMGKKLFGEPPSDKYWEEDGGSTVFYLQDQTFSADASQVPWLEKAFVAFQWNPSDRAFMALRKRAHHWDVVSFGSIPLEQGAFARAACIALIRGQRATKANS